MHRYASLFALILTLAAGCGPNDTGNSGYDAEFTPPDVPETAVAETVADSAEADAAAETAADVDATPDVGCVDCAHGCCDGHCCALDPTQAVLTDVAAGTRAIITPASLTFHTGADCHPDSTLGACDHVQLDETSVVCVCRVASLTVAGTLELVGNDALILLARDTITVDGAIELSARGATSGAGGGWSWADAAVGREGGIGGSFGSLGGGAVDLLGTPEQEPLTGGCLGQRNDTAPGLEGGRGGALQLSAGERITIGGVIRAHGGGGTGGGSGGVGGGSGGGIIIEAPRVDITGKVLAHGGGGAGAGGDAGVGGDGEDGRDDRAARGGVGADGAGCPLYGYVVGGDGGDGAFGDQAALQGQPGQSDSRCIGSEAWVGEGGGGGGVGRILIKTLTGCACVGTISPVPVLGDIVLH